MKYDFHMAYPGPLGPHLNHLSDYTRSRREEDRLRGQSIHPRCWGPFTKREIRNTCAAPKAGTLEKLRAALTEHLERHPDDQRSADRLAAL